MKVEGSYIVVGRSGKSDVPAGRRLLLAFAPRDSLRCALFRRAQVRQSGRWFRGERRDCRSPRALATHAPEGKPAASALAPRLLSALPCCWLLQPPQDQVTLPAHP